MHNVKEQITALLYGTGRPGIEWLVEWMDKNGFFEAPCSTQFHLADKGGLPLEQSTPRALITPPRTPFS